MSVTHRRLPGTSSGRYWNCSADKTLPLFDRMIRVMNDQKSRDRMTPGETTHFTSYEFTKEKGLSDISYG